MSVQTVQKKQAISEISDITDLNLAENLFPTAKAFPVRYRYLYDLNNL
jgi:hypothetical protein